VGVATLGAAAIATAYITEQYLKDIYERGRKWHPVPRPTPDYFGDKKRYKKDNQPPIIDHKPRHLPDQPKLLPDPYPDKDNIHERCMRYCKRKYPCEKWKRRGCYIICIAGGGASVSHNP
jgi:hypothetical protein